jgi:cell shape-determining protein MreC
LGDVTRVRTPKKGLFQAITVEPLVAFDRLEEVLVQTGPPPATRPSDVANLE